MLDCDSDVESEEGSGGNESDTLVLATLQKSWATCSAEARSSLQVPDTQPVI